MPFGLSSSPATVQRLMNAVHRENELEIVFYLFNNNFGDSSSFEVHHKNLAICVQAAE